jgi:D-arabinose 1-dehydrogenase-like Zn-dependent alcohol dehydrogenase
LKAAIFSRTSSFGSAMQAFVIDTYKGGLAQREMPDPSPRPGDVVVAISGRRA